MADQIPHSLPAPKAACAFRPLPKVVYAVIAIVLVLGFYQSQTGWSDCAFWWSCTKSCHDGRWDGIYDVNVNPQRVHSYYPVSLFVLLYPLGYLPEAGFRAALCLLIIATWFILYGLMRRAAPPGPLGFRGWVPLVTVAPLVGMLVGTRYLMSDLRTNQLHMLNYVPAYLGLFLMLPPARFAWQFVGAMLIAVAFGIKMFAVIFLAMLVCKGAWKLAGLSVATTMFVYWLLPYLAAGPEMYGRLQELKYAERWGRGLWLMEDSTELWSVANFFHYRTFMQPFWPELAQTPERTYQLAMAGLMLLVGLPVLRVLRQVRWKDMTALRLWEEVALVSACWPIIDPIGRLPHMIVLIPAFGLLAYRRLDDWHHRNLAPKPWEWAIYAYLWLCHVFPIRIEMLNQTHWYMHFGLYPVAIVLLYLLILVEIERARGSERRELAVNHGSDEPSPGAIPAFQT